MKRFLVVMAALLASVQLLAERIVHEPPTIVDGPSATIADMLASHPKPVALGAFPNQSYSFNPALLVNVVINSPGKNNTFFKTDYFLINGRTVSQEILIGFIAANVPNAGAATQRFMLAPSTAYAIDDFLGTGTGRLNKSGVGSLLITGVLSGTNTFDSGALLYGSARIWTNEPSSTGTNSFTTWAFAPGTIHGDVVVGSIGGRQNNDFRSNYGLVNLDSLTRSFTVIVTSGGVNTTLSATLPGISMAQIALPSTLPTGGNGYIVVQFFPNDNADFQWNAFVTSADNLTGDAWLSPAAVYPSNVIEY
jgi:hypothetical protein